MYRGTTLLLTQFLLLLPVSMAHQKSPGIYVLSAGNGANRADL